ncbi:MAG: FxsA family protein [Myxococcales bacterium]|nr:FxsA family protein [Myxococcales bacterium]
MFGRLLLLFTVVPALELWLLIAIGKSIGVLETIALILVTGILGAALAKREGFRVLRQWQQALAQGRMPQDGVVASLLVLVGGVLLVTPGVVTDAVGLLLLIPVSRRWIAARVRKRFEAGIAAGTVGVTYGAVGPWATGNPSSAPGHGRGVVIDVPPEPSAHQTGSGSGAGPRLPDDRRR